MLCKIQGRILQFSGHFNFPRDFAFGGYLLKVLFHFLCFQREINSFEESVKLNIQTFSFLIYFNQLIFSRHIYKNFAKNLKKNITFSSEMYTQWKHSMLMSTRPSLKVQLLYCHPNYIATESDIATQAL